MQGLYKGHGVCRGQRAVTRSEVLSMINMVDSMYNTREVSCRRLYVQVNGGAPFDIRIVFNIYIFEISINKYYYYYYYNENVNNNIYY